MTSTESWVAELENESKALKQVFDRAASNMTVYTKTVTISTTRNAITLTYPGGATDTFSDQERVLVTFNTISGANTIAKLECTCSSSFMPIKRLKTYPGGAQWMITNNPSDVGGGPWQATTYEFTVQSFLDGTLSAANATS